MLPLVKCFQTSTGHRYAFDGLTSHIITMRQEDGVASPKKEKSLLCSKGLAVNHAHSSMVWKLSFPAYMEKLKSSVPIMLLQLTCRCNLNCSYCIYSGHYAHMCAHEALDMSEEILFKSIDFYFQHSVSEPEGRIDFYGGEALLRFDLIQKAVDYANKVFGSKSVTFGISTNGVLLKRSIIHWLSTHPEVTVTVTVNGDHHDKYRIFATGRGSLDIIMENLRIIQEEYPNIWENQVRFIANIISVADIIPLRRFYGEHFHKLPLIITDINTEFGDEVIDNITRPERILSKRLKDRLREKYIKTGDSFLDICYGGDIRELHNRPIYQENEPAYMRSCLPGMVKLYVYANGRFGFCESTCDKVCVGDIWYGWDFSLCKRIYEQSLRLFDSKCRMCWAQRLCHICLKDAFEPDGTIRKEIPERICQKMRRSVYYALSLYCDISERNPALLDRYAELSDTNP